MELRNLLYTTLTQILIALTAFTSGAQISTTKPLYRSKAEPTVRIKCLTGNMLVTIKDAPVSHESGSFSGMIYPKGLSKNSTCLSEYRDHTGALKYKLPLRSCNTMPQETEDGGIEFFNTIVLQPHLKLVTDMGRGYHVRCRYKSREAAAADASSSKRKLSPQPYKSDDVNGEHQQQHQEDQASDRRDYGRSLGKFNDEDADHTAVAANAIASYDISDDVPMPGCHMKIFNEDEKIAENVKIGDALTLVINIDKQDIYGLHVTDCIVRDGLGWGEQKLVGDDGCPMDNEIMGPFVYNNDRLSANVTFPAHKFPYTASVYYQCNVRLCALQDPDCQKAPLCGDNVKRPKRQSSSGGVKDDDGLPATIEVYSGLYVNENNDSSESDDDSVFRERTEDAICVSQRTFAIAIAIAGLILMLAVVAAVLCIMARRRTKTVSHSGSSIYSGPYTNTAFSHSS